MSAATAKTATITFSLLRLSGLQRVAGALLLVAAIWLAVYWALQPGAGE